MREIIALLVLLTVAGLAITLAVKQKIGNMLTFVLLVFSLFAGWGIANYDWVTKSSWEFPGLAGFRVGVHATKEDALGEIRKEIQEHKQCIDLMMSNADSSEVMWETRSKAMESLLSVIKSTEESLKGQEERLKGFCDKIEQAKDQDANIHKECTELSLLLTRLVWLQTEASSESDPQRVQDAIKQIRDELDKIVNLSIPDPKARADFVSEVVHSLSSSQD